MIKNLTFGLIIGILFSQLSLAQNHIDSLFLKINLKFRDNFLELNKNYISKNDTLKISLLKFYLSGIEIEYNDKTKFVLQKKHHLIDIENSNSLLVPVCKKNDKIISKLNFNIGNDSLVSISGANSGDLDPQKGMYWAWQSGYINLKIEGKSNSCKTRKNAFQFHIGGYMQPNYALRNISINCNSIDDINLIVDFSKLFDTIYLKEKNTIIIPGKEAMQLADLSKNMFQLE